MKKLKPVKSRMFFQHIPIYEQEVCVIVGMTQAQAIRAAKKHKCSKEFIELLEDDECTKNFENLERGYTQGSASYCDNHFFLFLKPAKNDWHYLDILNHEVFHLSQFLSKQLNMWDELEPPAYLHSWLFKTLRRELMGLS